MWELAGEWSDLVCLRLQFYGEAVSYEKGVVCLRLKVYVGSGIWQL